MQQQQANYDLLAVFTSEAAAEAAAAKLNKEGFGENEVFQLPAGSIGSGEFREHGPNRSRSEFFLQTQRSGPNPALIATLAIVLGVIVGGGTIEASALHAIAAPEPASAVGAGVIGAAVGAIIGFFQRGRVRGAIGQENSRATPMPRKPAQGANTIVALRFDDPENISRKSRARAILINNGGKIDRSVGRTE